MNSTIDNLNTPLVYISNYNKENGNFVLSKGLEKDKNVELIKYSGIQIKSLTLL
jgi:hypothetical protein